MARVHINDHRGRSVPLCGPEDLPDSVPKDTRSAVVAANQYRMPLRLRGSIWMLAGVAIAIVPLFNAPQSSYRWRGGLVTLIFYAALIPIMLLLYRTYSRRWGAPAAVEACQKQSLCASCGYSLAGSRLEDDGCAVCAECGAAWRPFAAEVVCRVCRYALRGQAPLEDGRVICPECGRANRLPT